MNKDILNCEFKQQIRTRLNNDSIELETWQSDFMTDTMRKVSSQYVNLRDQAVKDGLLALGWTPPEVHPSGRESYFQHECKKLRDDKNRYLTMYNEAKEELDSFKEKLKEFLKEEEDEK